MHGTVSFPKASDPCAEFTRILTGTGLHAALGYLNGRTRHRFTAVYRFDPPMLRNVCVFDRENPALASGSDVPMRESYCSLVAERRHPFATADAGRDPAVRAHPARDAVLAYCGAPLLTPEGDCIGALCHHDTRPRIVPVAEIPLLERVAPVVAAALTDPARHAAPGGGPA